MSGTRHVLGIKPLSRSLQDKMITVIQFGALVVVILIAVGTFIAVSNAGRAADSSGEIAKSTRIAACQSNDYAKVAAASQGLDQATADLLVLQTEGLAAVLVDDSAEQSRVLTELNTAAVEVDNAAQQLATSTQRYVDGAALAADDPDRFLDEWCREPGA